MLLLSGGHPEVLGDVSVAVSVTAAPKFPDFGSSQAGKLSSMRFFPSFVGAFSKQGFGRMEIPGCPQLQSLEEKLEFTHRHPGTKPPPQGEKKKNPNRKNMKN